MLSADQEMQLRSIYKILGSIISSLDHDHDLDLDHSNLKDQDSIRSDEDQRTVRDKFVNLCVTYGLNTDGADLASIQRSMSWVCDNLEKIKSPAAYLAKIVKNCPQKRIGFKPNETKPLEECQDTNMVFGFTQEQIKANIPGLTREIYLQVRTQIPAYKSFMPDYQTVMSSDLKKRTVVAYAMKSGLL